MRPRFWRRGFFAQMRKAGVIMKTCNYCGESNNDENRFCIVCGRELDSQQTETPQEPPIQPPAQQPPAQQQPPGQQPYYMPTVLPEQPYTPNPAQYTYGGYSGYSQGTDGILRVRELAASKLVLALAIIWLSEILLSFLSNIAFTSQMASDIPLSIYDLGSAMPAFTMASGIIGMAPMLLMGIGLLMVNRSANDRNSPLSPSGIVLIRVITIIQFVFMCLAIFALLIIAGLIIGGSASGFFEQFIHDLDLGDFGGFYSFDTSELSGMVGVIGSILLMGAIIGGALVIVFYIILLKFLGSIINTIRTGIPQEKFSTALAVLAFIVGGFAALGTFGSLASALSMAGSYAGLVGFFSSALGAAAYILFGVLALKYKQAVYQLG